MEHVSAPLGRVLSGIAEAPRFYRSKNGMIVSVTEKVISIPQARDLIALCERLAAEHEVGTGAEEVRADLIRIHRRMVSELTAAIAAAEAYECEPRVAEVAA